MEFESKLVTALIGVLEEIKYSSFDKVTADTPLGRLMERSVHALNRMYYEYRRAPQDTILFVDTGFCGALRIAMVEEHNFSGYTWRHGG